MLVMDAAPIRLRTLLNKRLYILTGRLVLEAGYAVMNMKEVADAFVDDDMDNAKNKIGVRVDDFT